MAINYKKTAEEIIRVVNKENIISAAFCATRLRLIVKDRESIKDSDVQKIDGVNGVFFNSRCFSSRKASISAIMASPIRLPK